MLNIYNSKFEGSKYYDNFYESFSDEAKKVFQKINVDDNEQLETDSIDFVIDKIKRIEDNNLQEEVFTLFLPVVEETFVKIHEYSDFLDLEVYFDKEKLDLINFKGRYGGDNNLFLEHMKNKALHSQSPSAMPPRTTG